jgi:hypothetical protein
MAAWIRFGDAGQQVGIAQAAQLGFEERPGLLRLVHAASHEQLSDDRRHAGGSLHPSNPLRVVLKDAPVDLAHSRRIHPGKRAIASPTIREARH